MDVSATSTGSRGLALLRAHLNRLGGDTPPAQERLEAQLGAELAHKLLFALAPCSNGRRAA